MDILVLQSLGCNLVLRKNHDLLRPLVTLLVLWMKATITVETFGQVSL